MDVFNVSTQVPTSNVVVETLMHLNTVVIENILLQMESWFEVFNLILDWMTCKMDVDKCYPSCVFPVLFLQWLRKEFLPKWMNIQEYIWIYNHSFCVILGRRNKIKKFYDVSTTWGILLSLESHNEALYSWPMFWVWFLVGFS